MNENPDQQANVEQGPQKPEAADRRRQMNKMLRVMERAEAAVEKMGAEGRFQEWEDDPRSWKKKWLQREVQITRGQMITQVTSGVFPAAEGERPEEMERKRTQLAEVLANWKIGKKTYGVAGFYNELVTAQHIKDPAIRQTLQAEISDKLRKSLGPDFTPDEISKILFIAESHLSLYEDYLQILSLAAVFEWQERRDFQEKQILLLDRRLSREERLSRLQSAIDESVRSGNTRLSSLRKQSAIVASVVTEQPSYQAREKADERQQEHKQSLEKLGTQLTETKMQGNLEHLSTEGLNTLSALVEDGGEDLARALLVSDLHATSDGLEGKIEEEKVMVTGKGAEAQCYLIHKGIKIPLGHQLNKEGYNRARLTKVARKSDAAYFENPSEARQQIWERLIGNEKERFMSSDEANLTQDVLRSLLSQSRTREDEIETLQKLHILSSNREPDFQYLSWWAIELHYLQSQALPQQFVKTLQMPLLERLAEKWQRENKLSILSFTEIAQLPPNESPRETGPEIGTRS